VGIVLAGFDVHRRQITFDALDADTAEFVRDPMAATVADRVGRSPAAKCTCAGGFTGRFSSARRSTGPAGRRIWPIRPRLGRGVARNVGRRPIARMLVGCGRCSRRGRLPEAWIPPQHISGLGMLPGCVRPRRRAHSLAPAHPRTLFHFGMASVAEQLRSVEGRACFEAVDLALAARKRIEVALVMADHIDHELGPSSGSWAALPAGSEDAERSLRTSGSGPLTATIVLAERGDASRLSSSRQAVRFCELDVGCPSLRSALTDRQAHNKVRGTCAGRCSKQRTRAVAGAAPTTPTIRSSRSGCHTRARRLRSRAGPALRPHTARAWAGGHSAASKLGSSPLGW
jgi:transposase